MRLDPKEVGHSLWRAKGGWLFSGACPRKNGRYLGSDMFVRHALPWTWLTVKSKYLRFGIFSRQTLPWTLACLLDSCYLELG